MPAPKWAEWQADNPPPGWPASAAKANRRFWLWLGWEVRFWLALTGLCVASGVAFLVWAVLHAI